MNRVKEKNGLTCLGVGTFPLDNLMVKHSKDDVETIYQHVGGTAGNVMSILAWMGWHTLPAARLDDSEVGYQLKADLESYGCDTRYLTNTPDGGTTILDIIHKTGRDGKPKMTLTAHSPRGGRFVNYRFWTLKQVQQLFDSLEEMPDVFFFDRCAPGNILLAQLFHERGVLVYYEPNEPVDRNFLRAVMGEGRARSPFMVSAPLSEVFCLGCIAQRLNRSFRFDPVNKQVVGDAAANALLKGAAGTPRKGWEEFYKV